MAETPLLKNDIVANNISSRIDVPSSGLDAKTSFVTVAIIGTAGRGFDASKMNLKLFERMMDRCRYQLWNIWKLTPGTVRLVSGGSAWCDHLAVRLWVLDKPKFAGCRLYLPCDFANSQFDVRHPCGKTLNELHNECSEKLKTNTLVEIGTAPGIELCMKSRSFYERNARVAADAQYMIALTWGKSTTIPADGGTKHTWSCAKNIDSKHKVHIPLCSLSTVSLDRLLKPQQTPL